MGAGAKISGNTATTYGGGVYVYAYATFIMEEGAIISGNTVTGQGGGVYVYADGGTYSYGNFIMRGGTISGNKADTYGGGVYIHYNGGRFSKQLVSGGTGSGTIYGNNEGDNSNVVINYPSSSDRGHAVYVVYGHRETTVTENQTLSYGGTSTSVSGSWTD
jgi:hypothetical protein